MYLIDKITLDNKNVKNVVNIIEMSAERLGILFIIVGMSLFSIQDVVIKLIASQVSLTQILFFRASFGTILLIFYLL